MPEEENITPEKELLNFIEGGKKPASTPEEDLLNVIEGRKPVKTVAVQKTARKGLSFVSPGGLKGRFAYLKTYFQKFSFKEFSLQNMNIILVLVTIILFGGIIVSFITSALDIDQKVEAAFTIPEEGITILERKATLKKSAHYIEKARQRDIFEIASKMSLAQKTAETPVVAVKEIVTKTESLKLVGISWSDDPDALIEDTKAKKTFFLKRGEHINDILVKAIFKDKVILSYKEDEIELK